MSMPRRLPSCRPPLIRLLVPALLALAVAACARDPLPVPEGSAAAARAPYPRLVPMAGITALPAPEDPSAALQARAAALKARAGALRAAE